MPLTRFRLDLPDRIVPDAGGHMCGPRNLTLAAALGAQMDANADQVIRGRLQAIPWAGGSDPARTGAARLSDGALMECEPFVLPLLARSRGIRLYSESTLLANRMRVARWQQIRASFGRHEGQLRNAQSLFVGIADGAGGFLPLPVIKIFHQSNEGTPTSTCHQLDAAGRYTVTKSSPSIWNYDGAASKSSRWWAAFHLPPGFGSAFHYDDGPTYDSGAIYDGVSTLQIADIVDALLEAKGAGSRLAGVFLTSLQPGDDIPGYPGRKPFDPTDAAFTDADGWTSLPIGNWGSLVYTSGPYIGLATMPPWASLVYSDNP